MTYQAQNKQDASCFHIRLKVSRQVKKTKHSDSRPKMEASSCFCVAAAAVYVFTVLLKLKGGCHAGFWTTAAVVSLYFIVPPVVHGVLLLCSSLILVYVTERRVKQLPAKGRAVLVTGENGVRGVG